MIEDRQCDPELRHVVSQHDGNVRVFDWRIKFVERNEPVADSKGNRADSAEDFWKILNILDARTRSPNHCDKKAAVDGNAVNQDAHEVVEHQGHRWKEFLRKI